MASYICEDLMVNIFKRLPPKSIIRFRSLSKSWYSHLASPDFIRKHRSSNKNRHQKVLVRHQLVKNNYELRDIFVLHPGDRLLFNSECGDMGIKGVKYFPNSDPRIVGSCNGILCLNDKGIVNLWNFSIRRKLTLPSHPSSRYPLKEPNVVFGFGFDSITDDYKIVCISYCEDDIPSNINAYIYSLKRNSWNAIASPTSLVGYVDSDACFFKETLHWVVTGKESLSIITFSLTTHVFGTFEFPESSHPDDLVMRQLNIINGSLALISSCHDHNWIWVMQEYGNVESWSKFCKFKTEDLGHVKVLQPIANGDLLIYDEYGWCYVYNPEIGKLTELMEFGSLPFQDVNSHNIEMETYVESLELLDRGIACGETRLLLV